MKQHNKLVRDRILEILDQKGVGHVSRVLDAAEFKEELLKKLLEESSEVVEAASNQKELIKEIGDVLEVIDAIVSEFGLSDAEIQKVKLERHEKRGGFEKKIFLVSTQD